MSYKPHRFGLLVPTAWVLPSPFFEYQAYWSKRLSSPPKLYAVFVAALQEYSHSASVGKRYCFLVFSLSFRQNAAASFHDTVSTGRSYPTNSLGLLLMMAFHCPWVTRVADIRNAFVIST